MEKVAGNVQRKGGVDQLNRMWLDLAEAAAKKRLYKEALAFLEREYDYQYQRNSPAFLSGQNRTFFVSVIQFEAEILGALGRGFYPTKTDHFIMPLDVNGDGVDEFVALEQTTSDEQNGVSLPAIPKGKVRNIFYLLERTQESKYTIKESIEILGAPGKGTKDRKCSVLFPLE